MRGLAAKIGQTLSYVDGLLPEAQRESYERMLSALRDKAPRSSWTAIKSVVETDLGGSIAELYASFEPEPFASASIGQVHRATLADGRAVAVKVQHPGIADAVESDLKNAGAAEGLVTLFGPQGIDPKAAYEEISRRFREELDYTLEAKHQLAFATLHAGDPHIRVPDVIPSRSSRRVLTTALAEGCSLEEAATRPENERRQHAETLWRFVFKGNLVAGMFNADPHPGNYLFGTEGRVTFLDFGCVQPIDPARLPAARGVHRAAIARDERAFVEQASILLGLRGGEYGAHAVAYSRRCFDPIFHSPFRLTREYTTGLVKEIQDLKRSMFAKDKSFVMLPPSMLLLNRLQFGFYSVLSRLDVSVDYASVERDFLGAAGLL
jgi:predicted unusual protein kinase regulating ubiquinone biosynthesis (AarF/ABC1/UbiB family)